MTKLQLLHRALNERMMAAVEQIMEMVGGTVLEYEEETARVRKENEVLKRRLQWMDEGNRANWPGPSELVAHSTPDASNPSQPEESAVSFEFGQESQAVVIKTEFSDHPLYARPVNSLSTLPQNTNQESAIAGTSTDVNYSQTESMTWPSNQSYMEPLEFDPTSSTSIRCRAGRGKRQRMSFACPDCGKVFGREQGLLFHMRTHSKEKPYAYRRRKACFYGDGTRKKKLRGLSQISGENADDLLDENHENANSPSSEHPDEEWEADSPSDNSDQTNNANNPESIASNPVPLQRQRRKKKKCRCPLCGQRFHKVDDLEFHMKSHMAVAKQSLHNLPSKAQSGRERKKKMRKNVGVVQKTTEASRRLFPCPDCDRVFSRASLLDSHVKSRECEKASLHEQLEEKVPEQTEQPEENTEMVVPEDNGSTEVPSKPKVKKTLHCPHCPKVFSFDGWLRTHIQAAHCEKKISEHFGVLTGIGRTRSQKNQQVKNKKCVIPSIGTHPCQICYKVYSSESYLRKHMNFHLKGNLAVTEQQSKTDAMGNNNGNASGKHSSGNTSEESEGEETIDRSKTIETNQQRSKLQAGTSLQEPKSGQLASQDSCNNSYENDQFGPVLMSHFSLQPRVVLEPIMPKPMYWSTVPSADALKSGRFESSKFDLAQASSSVLVDSEMVMNKQAVYHCTRPVESFGHRNQNKVEAICRVLPKTDIVCVTVGLSQNDSQSDVQNQEHSIIIDEPDETMTQTSTVESLKLTGTTSDCKEISAKKLQTAVSESVFNKTACGVITKMCNPQLLELNLVFSDDEDKMDDVATASKGFDENKTENRSSHGLPNDSQGVIVTDDETAQSMTQTSTVASVRSELITAVENAPKEPGVTKQTKLTMNEKTAVSEAVSKDDVNDAPSPSKGFNEKETVQLDENLCLPNDSQNSETVSIKADDAACSHSKNVDGASQQTDAEDCSNNTQVNIQISKSFGDDSEESEILGKMDSSVPNVKTNESSVKGSEEADMLSNSLATSQSSEGSCKNTKSCTEEKVDCKGGCESLPNQNSGSDSPAQEKSVLEPLRSSNLDFCYSDATDSSKGTREPTPKSESANQSHTDLNIGNDALHESLVQQTDDPQLDDGSSAVNQPHQIPETSCVSDISCSDTQQITDQESDHKTGFSEDLQFFSKPKEKLTLNSSSSQNLDLQSSDDTQQTHGSPDLKLISDPQPERIGSPDPSKGGNWPNSYSDPNSNPSVQDIKPRAVGQIFYLKSNDCDVRESYILAGDGSDEDVEAAQNNSSTSATGTTKRKRVNKNVSPKEESSKKRHLSAQSQSFPDKDALSTISVEKAEQVPEHYTNSSYEKSKLYNINYCLYCRKPCYNMISHLQTAHAVEPEVAKALNFDKNSNERRQILNLLQTRGNFLHNTNAIQDSEGDADSLRRFAAASLFNDNVYCIYCLGLFSKKSFATHLEQCKSKGPHNAEDSCNEMSSNTGLRSHGPVPVPLHSSVKVDVKLEPSHFSCLNTPYEKLNVTTEKISSPHPDPKTVSTYLTLNHSSTKRVSSTLNSVSFSKANPRNIEVNQLTTECKTEEVCLPLCNADQERELTPVSDTNPITIHPNHSSKWTFEVPPRSPCYDFSPPHNVQTLYNDLGKNSTIAQTCRTGRRGRRRKRRSRFQNQSWGMEDSLSDVNIPDSKVYACHHCTAAFCSPYTLRRHEYTHTGERPFWCNLCNVGFIQKYRLLCHTAKYHGSSLSADHGNRPKRKVHGENKSMTDDANQDQSAVSPGHLSDAVIMNTEEDVASTNQDTDTEMRDEAHLEETSSLLQLEDPDTDC